MESTSGTGIDSPLSGRRKRSGWSVPSNSSKASTRSAMQWLGSGQRFPGCITRRPITSSRWLPVRTRRSERSMSVSPFSSLTVTGFVAEVCIETSTCAHQRDGGSPAVRPSISSASTRSRRSSQVLRALLSKRDLRWRASQGKYAADAARMVASHDERMAYAVLRTGGSNAGNATPRETTGTASARQPSSTRCRHCMTMNSMWTASWSVG